MRRGFLQHSVLFMTAAIFLAVNTAWALPTQDEPLFPSAMGSIEETGQGPSGKTIYFIQDAHDSLEAQENIARIIKSLVEARGLQTVFEEGFEGPVPTDKLFGFMEQNEGKEAVSFFLLDRLRLGGAEYAHINRDRDFKLIGVDNFQLYLDNVQEYRQTAQAQQETDRDLGLIAKQITKLSNRHFPKEIKEWMKLRERFDAKKLDLLNYLKRSRELSQSVISPDDFKTHYPDLSLILSGEPVQKIRSIDPRELFEEIGNFETELARHYLTSERDREIFRYLRAIHLLERLNRLELTPEEYDAVRELLQSFKTADLALFLAGETRKTAVLSKRWESNIQKAVRFYEMAHKRDDALSVHLDKFLQDGNEKEAILVFGGFHKAGIKTLLEKKGISYAVISPRITQEDLRHQAYYRELMTKGHYPYEAGQGAVATRNIGVMALTKTAGLEPVLDYTRRLYEAYLSAKERSAALGNRFFERVKSPALAAFLASSAFLSGMPTTVAEEPVQPPAVKADGNTSEAKIKALTELLNKGKVRLDDLNDYLSDADSVVVWHALQVIAVKKIPVKAEFIKPYLNYKENEGVVGLATMIAISQKIPLDIKDLDFLFQSPDLVPSALLVLENQSYDVSTEFLKPFFESPNTDVAWAALRVMKAKKKPATLDFLKPYLNHTIPAIRNVAFEIFRDQKIPAAFDFFKSYLSDKETEVEALKVILANGVPVTWRDLRRDISIGKTDAEFVMLQIARDQKLEVPQAEAEDFLATNRDIITEEIFKLSAARLTQIAPDKIKSYFDYTDEEVAAAAISSAENPDFPLQGAEGLRSALEHKSPLVARAALKVIRARNFPVTFDQLGFLLNFQDQGVRDDVRKLFEERKISIPSDFKIGPIEKTVKGRSLGQAIPIEPNNDITRDFNIARYLDEPKAKKVIYVDFRNIQNDQLTPDQIKELYAYASLYRQFVTLVIYNATRDDKALSPLNEVTAPENILEGGLNKAVARFGHLGTNIQLSKEGVDPFQEADKATAEKVKFFRYQGSEIGLVTAALLYAELDKTHQILAGIQTDDRGYLRVVGDILERLSQEYAGQLVVQYSA